MKKIANGLFTALDYAIGIAAFSMIAVVALVWHSIDFIVLNIAR